MVRVVSPLYHLVLGPLSSFLQLAHSLDKAVEQPASSAAPALFDPGRSGFLLPLKMTVSHALAVRSPNATVCARCSIPVFRTEQLDG